MKAEIILFFRNLQDQICSALEDLDGSRFIQDEWERPGGGGGRTRVIQGNIIEKGGVNFSAVEGTMPENIAKALNLPENQFLATGVSIVLHPVSPMVPIIHMNVRYFETDSGDWWFGGGIDLTPHYIIPEDAKEFHHRMKATCDKHDHSFYPEFKKWADDYFYIKHRKETRGIGGIFFDRLDATRGKTKEQLFDFVKDVGESFIPSYVPLVLSHASEEYDATEKQWQMLRRGRYVEFNLVYDKGTKFGLDTDGRIESILMSLPKRAGWEYDFKPSPGSKEEETLGLLKKGIDWV